MKKESVMTYQDLIDKTAKRKEEVIRELNRVTNSPAGFLALAEIERAPGTVAWLWLAKDFCEELAQNISHWLDEEDACRIYMAYEDNDPELYELLPIEAQLFS